MKPKARKAMPPPDAIKQALERVVTSETFVNSPRLKDFLMFIVEEQLAGRESGIKGKAIAVDVYQRELDEAGSAQNLVRVEARRLRRALSEYYSQEGQNDPLQIWVDAGSYRPRFERVPTRGNNEAASGPESNPQTGPETRRSRFTWRLAAMAAGLLVLVLAVAGSVAVLRDAPYGETNASMAGRSAKLAGLRELSLSSVQAANLAEQARGLFFPLFDFNRQQILLDTFRHVISLDPGLPGGYAGAAQVLALQSYMSDDSGRASDLLSEAQMMAERGVELGPTDAWTQAAFGWTLAVSGVTDKAIHRVRIAVDLVPNDGHVLDLVGITALLANDPELMAEVSDPNRPRIGRGRFGANNIWGTSQLMLGNYAATIEAFSTSAARGHPVSAPSLFLIATAYRELGDKQAARQAIEEMQTTWPDFPAKQVASLFFARSPATLSQVLATLEAYSTGP